MADDALSAAKVAGASYCDVRIGRYLRQAVMTRENKVQGVMNGESTGVGIRVIANGAWGFAATNELSQAGVVRAAQQAAAIAKANAKPKPCRCNWRKRPAMVKWHGKPPFAKTRWLYRSKKKQICCWA